MSPALFPANCQLLTVNFCYGTSRALTLISALNSFETGQPVSAFFTAASNFA